MATFTLLQQAQIRMYLGYPDIFRYKDVRLEGVITDVFSDEAVAEVAGFLVALAALDTKLGPMGLGASIAGLKRADDVEFYQGQGLVDLRSVGRFLASRISNILGVPFLSDPFGRDGYPGDVFSPGGFNAGSRNMIPLG